MMFEEAMIQQRVVMIEEVMIQQRALITVNLLQISGVRKVRYRFRSRRSTLARSGTDSRQVQYFRKVRSRFRGRRSTFARGTNFAAGAALSQGTVQSLTHAQH